MSTFAEGQIHQLADSLEVAGFTSAHITKLGQLGEGLSQVMAFLDGRAEIVMKKVETTVVSILTFVKTVAVPAVAGKETANCFTDESRYAYRDSDLDAWLPINQPAQLAGKFSVQRLTRGGTFKSAVESFLGMTAEIPVLAAELKKRGHVTTLAVIESLIERQENGEDVGLRTDGWWDFFFVEDGEGGVSVVYAHRDDFGQWDVCVDRLAYGNVWGDGDRFFFRNTDTVSL